MLRLFERLFPAGFLALAFALRASAVPAFDPARFQIDPRLELQPWASEPDIVDPVSICWDEDGRAYVAECRDYPYGVGPDGQVGSTVRRLEDTDGDGRPDKSTVFARDLSYVTSVTPWRGGVLVTAPPEILFLKDTDGDGVADLREVIVSGFHRGVSDSLVNGLRFGPDNRIHGANGGNGGTLRSPKQPGREWKLGDDDFSFNPDTGDVALTGRSGGGFGLVFDDFGRAFTTYNINHLQHRFLPRRHAEKFPGFPPIELTGSISDHEEMSRIYPLSTAQTRPNHPEQAGHFSAAGGMGIIGSSAFPADLRGSVLVGDVVGNLVHRDVIQPDGPVFVGRRSPTEIDREFFAAREATVRPVGMETGPDGALYLLDMQRDVIEHPDYIPDKVRQTINVRAGDDRGRIYRLTPKGGLKAVQPRLSRATDLELVAHLADDNPWWRTTAQRLLVERAARGSASQVRSLLRESPLAPGRVQALWTLQGLGELTPADLRTALKDPHPGVRENALVLAEGWLPANAEVAEAVRRAAADTDPRVRFVAAQTLGLLGDESAVTALGDILERDVAWRWSRLAVLSSLRPADTRPLLERLFNREAFRSGSSPAHLAALGELADLTGARTEAKPADVDWLIRHLDPSWPAPVRTALLDGLADGLGRSGGRAELAPAAREQLERLSSTAAPEEMRALWRVTRALGLPENPSQLAALRRAAEVAGDSGQSLDHRLASVRLLGLGSSGAVANQLLRLLDAREPVEIQAAAITALGPFREPSVGTALVERWRGVSPALRPQILALLLDRRSFHDSLLLALETGRLTVGELNLDLEQRRRLLRQGTPDIRARAAKFMGDEEYSNRKTLVTEWLARLPATGDPVHGRLVFLETCARCHVGGPVGQRVGPDLSGVAHRSVEDLLSNILDPNMAINPGFVAYTVETREGEAQQGLLQTETPDAVTLLQAGGGRLVIPRRDLVRIESSGQSLMPEGLEAGKSPQDLRDLIAFLQRPE